MNDLPDRLAEAKAKLPLDATMLKLDFGPEYLKASCKSPFREEKTPSWGVFTDSKGVLKWKDFTTGETGDQVDFVAQHLGCSTREAINYFLEMAGVEQVNGNSRRPLPKRRVAGIPATVEEPEPGPMNPFKWQACLDAFTPEKVKGFAEWRGYSEEFAWWLASQQYVGIYQDCPATPVVKDGIVVGCQYRTKDGPRYANDTPGEKTPALPLIIGKPSADALLVMESQWDAFAMMESLGFHKPGGMNDMLAFAVTRSASNFGKLAEIFKDRAKSEAPGDVILVGQNDKLRLDGKPTGHDTLEAGVRKLCAEIGLTVKLAMPPKDIKDVNDWTRADPTADVIEMIERAKASTKSKLTVRSVSELLEFKHNDNDNYFGDRILAEGQPATLLGPGGVGKSRLLIQKAICMITGRPFLGIATHAANKTWLIIQTENSNRRLQVDLRGMISGLKLSKEEKEAVNEYLIIHTVENDTDAFLSMESKEEFATVQSLITDLNPDFVVFDPLNTFTTGDLNSDADMRTLCTAITRATKRGNPKRVPLVLHHSLTGKAGAAKATGWEKGSFGRNSKVLYAWTRSQINITPRDPDDQTKLLITCGKNNNGAFFPDIAVKFDETEHIYVVDDDYDAQQFKEDVGLERKSKGRPSKHIPAIEIAKLVTDGMLGYQLKDIVIKEFNVGRTKAFEMIDECENYGFIVSKEHGKTKSYTRDASSSVK